MSNVLMEFRSLWKRDDTKFKQNVRILSVALMISGAVSIVVLACCHIFSVQTPEFLNDGTTQEVSAASRSFAAMTIEGLVAGVLQILAGLQGIRRSKTPERMNSVLYPTILAAVLWVVYAFGVYIIGYSTEETRMWSIPLMLTGMAASAAYFVFLFRNRGMIPAKNLYKSKDPWGRERF